MKLDEDMDNAAAQVAGALSTDPIDTAAREVVNTQRQAVKTSLYNALLENPDVAARAQRLGRETNLPADVVQRNFPEVERGIYLNKVDSMLQANPAVAEFLASPAFAAVAHDDVDNLGAMESALRGFKNTGGAAMSGLWSMASGAVGLARASADITAPLLDPAVGTVLPENPLRRTAQGLANVQGFLSSQADANMPKAQSIAGAGYFSGVASLSRNLAALPLALVNPQAALMMMVAPVAGEEYGKAREKNLAPIQSLTYGVTQGAIEYATERLPLLKLVGDLKVGAPLYQVVARQLSTEIPNEQLATILQDLNEWGTLNPDKPFADYLKERPSAFAQTLIATVVGVGGQVSVVKGIEALISMNQPRTVEQGGPAAASSAAAQTIMENALQMRMKAAQVEMTERDAQALTQLVDLVQASKLAARDPATFEQFVQSVAQNGPVQDVYISAQIFAQAAQEAGVTEQQLPPAVREQLAEALATGGDIRIPIEQFAAQIATTQYAQGLIDHMKTDPMGMSRAEAQVFMQTQVDEMQAQVERTLAEREADVDFRTSIDAVRTSFKTQLDTANRFTPEVNDSYANMLANFYAVTAAKAGMTPEELVQRYPLSIQAEGAVGASVMMDQGVLLRTVKPGDVVDGRVVREEVPNMSSIGASFEDYAVLDGIREVPMSAFDPNYINSIKPERLDQRTRDLMEQIKTSKELNPLIVAYDSEGAYIIEGGHRFDALIASGAKTIPAVVVIDQSNPPDQQFAQSPLPDTIEIDGVQRPTTNSNGQPIHPTEEGVRNFWAWFGDSKVVDDQGRPLVVYHGTDQDIGTFNTQGGRWKTADTGAFFSSNRATAGTYTGGINGGNVVPVYLRLSQPAVFDAGGANWNRLGKKTRVDLPAVTVSDQADADLLAELTGEAAEKGATKKLKARSTTLGRLFPDEFLYDDNFSTDDLARWARKQGYEGAVFENARDQGPTGLLANEASQQPSSIFVAFNPEQIKSAIGNDGTFGPANPNILNQSAYHGTPHKFDKFSLDAIGTGEGAQAYGWGLYFASQRAVAEFYRKQLSDTPVVADWKFGSVTLVRNGDYRDYSPQDGSAQAQARALLSEDMLIAESDIRTAFENEGIEGARREMLLVVDDRVARAQEEQPDIVPHLNVLRTRIVTDLRFEIDPGNTGAIYQVDVPEESELLAWEKPLSEQPAGVREKLANVPREKLSNLGIEIREGEFFDVYGEKPITGGQFQQFLEKQYGGREASTYLNSLGIPGLQYLDGTSRNPFPFEVQIFSATGTLLQWEKLRSRAEADAMVEAAKADGKNAKIIERGTDGGNYNYVIWDESRVTVEAVNDELRQAYQQGAGNRGQIAFGDDITKVPSIITLLKNADLSTFLHESGHFFLEVQIDLAARIGPKGASAIPGEQALVADAQTLLDWFGVRTVDEWFAMPMEQKRSYHEQFARGFEAYLFEGKAPSIELQGLFQRFRAWLLRIYKDMRALRVELTDDVRGVMDRMLATTEQIELAEKGRSMLPLFASAQQAGMTTDEFGAYQELGTQATQDAVQDLQARTLRDMQWISNARGREIKKLQKEAASRRAEVRIEARREILSTPVYQAWQFLTNKLNADDKAAVETRPPRTSTPGRVDETVDSLFTAIAKLGGFKRDDLIAEGWWDPAERSPMPIFGKYLVRREGGLAMGDLAESLAEMGYLPTDKHGKYDLRDFERLFDEERRGTPQFSTSKDYSDFGTEPMAGENVDFENVGAGRLDLGSLRSMPLPEEIVQILENLKMTAREGIHPDLVAESFGFTSGDELVRMLAIAEAPKVAIEGLTDQKMLERYGDLATPEAIQRAADAAIHNEARARFVATELNALQKATGKPKVLASAAREYAKAMIDRLQVRNVKPNQYAAAEVRAAKAAEKAMKAGDTATAAAEKRNQLINTYATKSAHDAITEVEKALRYLKKFQSEGVRQKLDVDYLDQIDAILERFDLRTGQSLKSVDKRKALVKWIGEQEELGIEVELPEKVMAEAFRQSYKELTVEEMRGLVDSIKQIEHLGRLKEKLLTAKDNRRFAEVVQTMVDSIALHADGKRANNRTRDTLGSRALNLFKGFVAAHRKTASLARELDGFNDAGPMWTYLIKSMNESGDREASMRADATRRLTELLKPVLAAGRMGGKGQYFASIGESLNRGEQLVLALNVGNAGNLQRLLDGRGWTDQQIVPVLQNLTAADWQFVQSVWDFFESYRPEIAAKERRVMGKEPDWVQPQAFTVMTRDGQELAVRGGYFPIVYDARESGRAERQADAEQAKQMMKGAFVAATTRRSFTKTRAEAVTGRPLVLTWDALFRGVNDVIHDLTWHEWVIDANRIMRNDKVDKAIRTTYGADVVQQFKTAIRDIAAGDAPNLDALSRVLTPLRTGAAVAGLGFNLMNAMIQPLGLTQSMVRIGSKWVGLGIAEWAKSPVSLVRNIHGKSEFMRNRARTMQRELNEIQSVVQGKGPARQKIDAVMFVPMQSLQLIADVPTWWGAYQKALAEAPLDLAQDALEDRAVKLADQAVIDAQSGGQVKDLALIQRGGPLQKLFTVFYGYFSASYNLGVEKAKATNFRKPLDVMHLAWDFLLLYSVPAVLASLLKDVLQPGDDDGDEEELARKLIGEQISYLMGTMVGLREITGAVQFATGTRQFNMGYGGPAGLRFFQELDKLGQQIGQGELDRALLRSTVNVGGVMLHLPSSQINRTIDGVIAISEGKTGNPAALLFGPAPEAR